MENKDKKKLPVGRWLITIGLIYLTIVTALFSFVTSETSCVGPFCIIFAVFAIFSAPRIIKVNKSIKICLSASVGMIVFLVLWISTSISICGLIGKFLAIVFLGFIVLRFFAIIFIGLVMGLFILLGCFNAPYCWCWW